MTTATDPKDVAAPDDPSARLEEDPRPAPARKMTIEQLRRVGERITEAERWLKEHLRTLRR
jgi:hypothetical protein